MQQRDMTVANYTSKIKDICDSIASINVIVEEGEMVKICHGGFTSKFGAFRIAVCTRENTPSFFDLQSMLVVEENHVGVSTSTHADNKMLYTERDMPCGRGGRGESVRNGGGRWDQGRRHGSDADNNSGPYGNRGSPGDENRQGKSAAECWYYGKKGHKESEC